MKNLKVLTYRVLALLSVFSFGGISLVNAVSPAAARATPVPVPCPLPQNLCTFPGVVATFSSILFPLVGLGLFAMLVYGGVTKLTAAGDAEKEKKAMQIIQNSVIGAIIIALAGVIVTTVGALLGVKFF